MKDKDFWSLEARRERKKKKIQKRIVYGEILEEMERKEQERRNFCWGNSSNVRETDNSWNPGDHDDEWEFDWNKKLEDWYDE